MPPKMEPRREPGLEDDLVIPDYLTVEDCAPVPNEPADLTLHTDTLCTEGERCGRHYVTPRHPGIQLLSGEIMNNVLRDVFANAVVDTDWETLDGERVLKLMTFPWSLIRCDGTVVPGYLHVKESGLKRHNSTGRDAASELMLTILFNWQDAARAENDVKGWQAHDTFKGELIREHYDNAIDKSRYDVAKMLFSLEIVEKTEPPKEVQSRSAGPRDPGST